MSISERNLVIPSFVLVFILMAHFFLSVPEDFPNGVIFNIKDGASLGHVASDLKDMHMIRSRFVFEIFTILYGGEHHLVPGDYVFKNNPLVFNVAQNITSGNFGIDLVKLTIPEGFNVLEISAAASAKLRHFDTNEFLALAKDKEGYLFPDTYFLFPIADSKEVLKNMSENFDRKIQALLPDIQASGKSENQIITMASIIEREASGAIDRGVISGILWNRIAKGMALQADAAPETYKARGLPASPICNPGLAAIQSAIHPTPSPYLFYLHDKSGMIHYARTFAEHQANIAKYLK